MGVLDNIKSIYSYAKETALSSLQDIILKQTDNQYLSFGSSILAIHGYSHEDSCLYLKPNQEKPLYCVNVSGDSNMNKRLDILQNIATNHGYRDNARIVLFYNKSKFLLDEEDYDFCTKQNVYLFTSSREIAQDVEHFYDTDLLTPEEIIKALLDIGAINTHRNDMSTFETKSSFSFDKIPFDDMAFGFKAIFSEGVYGTASRNNEKLKSKFNLYQGLGTSSPFSSGKPHIKKALKEDWLGYIAIIVELNSRKVNAYINDKRKSTRDYEKNKLIKRAYKDLKEGSENRGKYCITNIVAYIDNDKAINRISNHLNIEFIPIEVFRKKIIYGTPIIFRDYSCDGFMSIEDCSQYIQSVHKKQNVESSRSRDIYGKDITGNYISYSFSETEESPHWAIVAPTRSGKTFFIMEVVNKTIGGKVEKKTELELEEQREEKRLVAPTEKISYCTRLGENRIVHFDTGYSALKYAVELKRRYPDDVVVYDDNLDLLRFGITDIYFNYDTGKISQEDMLFSFSTMNLILELNGEKPFSARERTEISEALERVFVEDKYGGMELYKLEQDGGYEEVLLKIKEKLGGKYDPYTKTTELGLRGTEIEFIQKPLLSDVLKELDRKAKNTMVKEHEKVSCIDAFSKINIVSKIEMFSMYSQSNIVDSKYFYMELEVLKNLGENIFLPVFVTIIQRLYRRDVKRAQSHKNKGEESPKVIYILEEAHNLFKIKSLVEDGLLDVLMREAARYNLQIGFITQDTEDFPTKIINNIGNRIVMPSNRITGKQLKASYWANRDGAEADFYDNFKEKYYAFINNGKGVLTIMPNVTEEEASILNSNAVTIRSKLEEIERENIL